MQMENLQEHSSGSGRISVTSSYIYVKLSTIHNILKQGEPRDEMEGKNHLGTEI